MPRKKKTTHTPPYEFRNIIVGSILVVLAVLVSLATNESSYIGELFRQIGIVFFGTYYQYISSSILYALGGMILFGQASWSFGRFIGIMLYYISLTTLVGIFSSIDKISILDIHTRLGAWIGASATLLACIAILGVSIWMTLRISYRQILRGVHEKIISPGYASVRDSIVSAREERAERMQNIDTYKSASTDTKTDAKYKNKVDMLEEKLARLSKPEVHTTKEKFVPPYAQTDTFLSGMKSRLGMSSSTHTEDTQPTVRTTIEKSAVHTSGGYNAPVRSADRGDTGSKIRIDGQAEKPKEAHTTSSIDFGKWDFPGVDILNTIAHRERIDPQLVEEKSLRIQRTLLQFGIDVEMVDQYVGPTVIQYRLRPADGVKLQKIVGLKDNLTLALKAKSIRIQAPIPGVGLVGIEVPNDKRDTVSVKELLSDKAFTTAKSPLSLVLGKDIGGENIVGDLAKMPHLLIAGQTGSGKSVGMNGFILSLLYKNTPAELRMIMVDPKQVELGIYDGIPHLLTPVINTADKALNALKWCVAEMERRYGMLKAVKVRNLEEYNEKMSKKDKLPCIVIIIDELADLMMSGNKKEVEASIQRIAQKARAIGMHLILATQRPSVNVITGVIKANVPSRIAFTVASNIDSRTVLDQSGAEDLLGRGDMLYYTTGMSGSLRVQGVLVETDEIERVVNHIKRTIDPAMLEELYDKTIADGDRGTYEGSVGGGGTDGGSAEDQKIIDEAIELVRTAGKCSTSMIQMHMKLGYGRAARVVNTLESMGIVGPADGSRPREVIG